MVVSLIIAGFFAFIAGAATWAVVRLQRSEIADSKVEFDKYKLGTTKQIAEADARTKEAEVRLEELRRLSAPRGLNRAKFLKALEGKPTMPVEILFLREAPDASWLAKVLADSLREAGWGMSSINPLPELDPSSTEYRRGDSNIIAAGGQGAGITVVHHGEPNPAVDALMIAIGTGTGTPVRGTGGDTPVAEGKLRVIIGPKSEPLYFPKAPAEAVQAEPNK
jgi:hypothetical protein